MAPSQRLCNYRNMKHSCLFSLAIICLTTACNDTKLPSEKSSALADPPVNCSHRPSSFVGFGDTDQGQAIARGDIVERGYLNKIYVIWSSSRFDSSGKPYPQIIWNGSPIDYKTLSNYLDSVSKMAPVPMAILDFPAGAPCKDIEIVRRMMAQRLHCPQSRKCVQEGMEPYLKTTPEPQPTPR